ncbi:CLUMA_CG017758, isoform A [Clunio marinus]|uniref:CLUMA_CG017758, isoform A n=1 Tax=Clunio marinus TaxID=568069 RepID=A0A1J1IZU4_9DIPT|nr:CLUMA_CG017758, isoform A [Clunio marinus]
MSIISSRKSLNSSILKSSVNRNDSIKKAKILRFEVQTLSSVKEILTDLDDNPNLKCYQNLIYKLSDKDIKDEELRKIISECIECVSVFRKDHILLVQSLLDTRWIMRSNDIIELFHRFILNLMTSKSDFLMLCLSKIIGCFIPDDDESDFWCNGIPTIEMKMKLNLVHTLIAKILEVMPMIPVTLRKEIRSEFPYFKEQNFKIVGYIHNLFMILEYCPSMTYDIVDLVLENLVMIDVNVTREQIELSEADEDENDEDIMKLPVAETLDLCMEKVFNFIQSKFEDNSDSGKRNQKMIIQAIFTYFDEQILKTHTKHVHFILFYIASLEKTFLNDFLNFLWRKTVDRNQSPTIRQIAIGYLSSFLSRTKFLPMETLKNYLTLLSDWAHDYIKACDFNPNKNPKAHVVFYSVCQAMFYIIAFRGPQLTRGKENLKFLLALDLWPIVKHPLNPLNVCLPAIVTIFDNITTKYQILFCRTIIVNNASKCLTTVYANEQHRPEEVLESVFPFDPYLLKKSGKRIFPLYVEYEGIQDDITDSPLQSRKRTRNESTSCDLEDFIIKDSKIQKLF